MRPPKKTEIIELRISPEDKDSFQAKCREDGVAGSEVIRRLIQRHVQSRSEHHLNRTDWSQFMTSLTNRGPLSLTLGGASALIATLVWGTSFAVADPVQAFHAIDQDGDGEISFTEYAVAQAPFGRLTLDDGGQMLRVMGERESQHFLQRDFRAYDHDDDGRVQVEEFTPRYDVVTRISFAMMDKDVDGSLTLAEMQSLGDGSTDVSSEVDTAFTALDGDSNGSVTLREYRRVEL